MKIFIYETHSAIGYGTHVLVISAASRAEADELLLNSGLWDINVEWIDSIFSVEEMSLETGLIFSGIVAERDK